MQTTHTDTAVKALHHGVFDMKKLSIIGADYHSEEDVVGFYNTGDRMRTWGKYGAFWGLFFGAAFFVVARHPNECRTRVTRHACAGSRIANA